MKVLVTGSTGFIGSRLVAFLRKEGYVVKRLVRDRTAVSGEKTIFWDPSKGEVDREALEGAHAVIHLNGESLIKKWRWDPGHKFRIRESRVQSTRFLATTLANLEQPPEVLISASGVGFYGDTHDNWVDEKAHSGTGFLADLCSAWEESLLPAQEAGIRVIPLRMGVVLDKEGGMIKETLSLFKMGLGATLGSGQQYMSWIAAEDLLRIFLHCMTVMEIKGVVNAVAPNPVTNKEWTKAFAKAVDSRSWICLPKVLVRFFMGHIAEEMLLKSERVAPKVLQKNGFVFRYPKVEDALRYLF